MARICPEVTLSPTATATDVTVPLELNERSARRSGSRVPDALTVVFRVLLLIVRVCCVTVADAAGCGRRNANQAARPSTRTSAIAARMRPRRLLGTSRKRFLDARGAAGDGASDPAVAEAESADAGVLPDAGSALSSVVTAPCSDTRELLPQRRRSRGCPSDLSSSAGEAVCQLSRRPDPDTTTGPGRRRARAPWGRSGRYSTVSLASPVSDGAAISPWTVSPDRFSAILRGLAASAIGIVRVRTPSE